MQLPVFTKELDTHDPLLHILPSPHDVPKNKHIRLRYPKKALVILIFFKLVFEPFLNSRTIVKKNLKNTPPSTKIGSNRNRNFFSYYFIALNVLLV